MTRLREAADPEYLDPGNHDAESVITRHLRLPHNVRTIGAKPAETDRTLEDHGVAVNGQTFENVHDGNIGWRASWINGRVRLARDRRSSNRGEGT